MVNEAGSNRTVPVKLALGSTWHASLSLRWLMLGLILCLFSAAANRWLGLWAAELPGDYANVTQLSENNQFRDTSSAEWQTSVFDVTRIDQTITSNGLVNMIEGSVHAYFPSGAVNFEAVGLYGVDRRTRTNLAGYGDSERSGQYLFPAHLQPGQYTLWDPVFIGPRQAKFLHSAVVEGLPVYVFEISANGLDETASYGYLNEVPERFVAHTDTAGTAWVEPLSGVVVDYEDNGVSYFIDPATGERMGDFNRWSERFVPETKTAQIKLAQAARLKILALEIWFPLVLLACGLACLAQAGFALARRRPRLAPTGDLA